MSSACPANPPPPEGFQIWRGIAPPPPLTQWAVDLRDHWMGRAKYGDTQLLDFAPESGGQSVLVLARKDHHTWTYKGGKLVTGICIPGITLYRPSPAALNSLAAAPSSDTLETPDPSAAVYSVDPGTDWGLVGITFGAAALTVGAFLAGLHFAGTARRLAR